MKFLSLAIAALLAMAQADPVLDGMVADYQNMVGTRSPDGALVRRIWVDGRAMAFDVEARPDYPREASWIIDQIANGICQRNADFFSGGRTVRIDISRAGRPLETASRDSCPPPRPPD